ncbi:MAG: hemin uptake protein HemP [Gammaproteobacteria bacterium]|nr:hemin uptake protein HemP [Gammaproteobacteria bacterium]
MPGDHDMSTKQPSRPAVLAKSVDETRRLDSRDLFGPDRRVRIVHGGETYLLQITRQGKLLLTK